MLVYLQQESLCCSKLIRWLDLQYNWFPKNIWSLKREQYNLRQTLSIIVKLSMTTKKSQRNQIHYFMVILIYWINRGLAPFLRTHILIPQPAYISNHVLFFNALASVFIGSNCCFWVNLTSSAPYRAIIEWHAKGKHTSYLWFIWLNSIWSHHTKSNP